MPDGPWKVIQRHIVLSDELPVDSNFDTVLYKLSGEMLGGERGIGLDADELDRVASELISVASAGIKTGVVVGGGNHFRGARNSAISISTLRAHQMGMLFTIANAIALEQALQSQGAEAVVQSSVAVPSIVELFDGVSFTQHLDNGTIVVFAGGTGCTHFTTDTAASLRAIEMKADILLKATDVEGVYDSDPAKNSEARMYDSLSFDQVLADNLTVMDAASIALCREHQMPIRVFNGSIPGNISMAGFGGDVGTLVHF